MLPENESPGYHVGMATISRAAFRAVVLVLGIGVLLGLAWALRSPVPMPEVEPPGTPAERTPAFADFFTHFVLGRTPDGSRPSARKPLLRATKAFAGERLGLRVQTSLSVSEPLTVELRFLTADTREERPELRSDRQRFRIRPGFRTYCCVRTPKAPGAYSIGVLVEGRFLAYLPLEVREPLGRTGGGLFAPVDE